MAGKLKAGNKKHVVMVGGVFDIIHPGHVFFLEKAKSLGDVLVVVVASDETVRRVKKREPVHSAKERARVVAALKPVDQALVGSAGDRFAVVRKTRPDIIAFGYDQPFGEFEKLKGIKLVRIKGRLNHGVYKTSKILKAIRESKKKRK